MGYMGYIVIAVVVLVLVLLLAAVIRCYNRFVRMRNRVKDQEAQIDVQLKRRCDLIPNLVETVKGYAAHEQSTLEAVMTARNQVLHSGDIRQAAAADAAMNGALHRLLAVSENYPELKASAQFLSLQQQLTETEDKVAKARQFYNDTVLKYNNGIQVFPASLIAALTGFRKMEFLKAEESEREPVNVTFS